MAKGDHELHRLMYKIARAYYEDDLTQAEIAHRFGLSRVRVSRLLTQARRDGVVRITVFPQQGRMAELERSLEETFGLDEVIVVDVPTKGYGSAIESIGTAAAQYLSRVIVDGQILGVTWGNTVLSTVDAMPSLSLPNSRAVQLLGGLGLPEADIHGAELVRRMAERLGCRPRNIMAPGIVESRVIRDALLADDQIADTLALAARSDVALLGIGALGPHSVLRGDSPVLSEADCSRLLDDGVVGDVALRFFYADGTPAETPFNDRTIGIEVEQLKAIPRRVAVVGGAEKIQALQGALAGGLVSVLVTDADSADALLSHEQGNVG